MKGYGDGEIVLVCHFGLNVRWYLTFVIREAMPRDHRESLTFGGSPYTQVLGCFFTGMENVLL